jgi:hypothetical protein
MSIRIAKSVRSSWLLWLCALCAPFGVSADEAQRAVVYDRELGELSPGTHAPSAEVMMNSIRSASPMALTAMLEYGERVECMECIPLLETKLLEADDAKVREMAAWWLRRRPFGYGRAAVRMRAVLADDPEPVRRARAAEALGEFLDPSGVPALESAVVEDGDAQVRLAGVRALGRLNARAGHAAVALAFEDEDARVRRAALDQVLKLSFFRDKDAVIGRLSDEDRQVRRRAAQLAGELRAEAAVTRLAELLQGDDAASVRQAAAWALGRIGGSAAQSALRAARETESDPAALDAIEVAVIMARGV